MADSCPAPANRGSRLRGSCRTGRGSSGTSETAALHDVVQPRGGRAPEVLPGQDLLRCVHSQWHATGGEARGPREKCTDLARGDYVGGGAPQMRAFSLVFRRRRFTRRRGCPSIDVEDAVCVAKMHAVSTRGADLQRHAGLVNPYRESSRDSCCSKLSPSHTGQRRWMRPSSPIIDISPYSSSSGHAPRNMPGRAGAEPR